MKNRSASSFVSRSLGPAVRRAMREFPVAVVAGPRQSGKTTLLRKLFPIFRYVLLDAPDLRAAFAANPRGLLEQFRPPAILDEVQNAPNILPYIKERIDQRRHVPGQYLLSGSQNLLLMAQIAETLAGHAAVLRLLPMTQRELDGWATRRLPWEIVSRRREDPMGQDAL